MPEFFSLQIRDDRGRWWEQGVYFSKDFVRREDGSYFCQPIGSPVYFRCVAHRDGYFEHIDGGGYGQVYAYRLVPRNPEEASPRTSSSPRSGSRTPRFRY